MPAHARRRPLRPARSRLAVTAAAAGLVASTIGLATVTATAAASAKGTLSYSSLATPSTLVTSSSHAKLRVFVDAFDDAGSSSNNNVSIFVARPAGSESHSWQFHATGEDLTLGSSGSLSAPMGRYGVMNLHYTPVGKANKQSCDAADYTVTQQVALHGKLLFNTRSKGKHKWGKFGSKRFPFHVGTTVTHSYGSGGGNCQVSLSNCASGIAYSADSQDLSIFIAGYTQGKRGVLNADRRVPLATPQGAIRQDDVAVKTAKPKLVKGSGHETDLKVITAKSGSFTLASADAGQKSHEQCKRGKHTSTEHRVDYTSATYQDGKPRLSVQGQVFGPIRMPKSGSSGGFIVITA